MSWPEKWKAPGSHQANYDLTNVLQLWYIKCFVDFIPGGTLLLKGRECSSEILKTIPFWGRIVGVAWNVFPHLWESPILNSTSSSFCHSFSPKWERIAADLVRNQNRFLTAKMYGELIPFFLYGSVSPGFWFMECLRITFYMTAPQPKRDMFPFLRF